MSLGNRWIFLHFLGAVLEVAETRTNIAFNIDFKCTILLIFVMIYSAKEKAD
jgi:hypothetical protein